MKGRPKKRSQGLPSRGKKKEEKSPVLFDPHDADQLQADFAALDEFCKQVTDIDDVSLEDWEDAHRCLDVQVPMWLHENSLGQDPTVTVKFTRRILSSTENGILKEAAEVSLSVPIGTRHGAKFTVPGLGDRHGTNRGDLIIVIYLRKPASSS